MAPRRQQRPFAPACTATIRDVASRAGVPTATVSRVLADLGGAGPDVRKHVAKAAEELHYQPNRVASALRARTRKVVGVLIPDLQNPFFTSVCTRS